MVCQKLCCECATQRLLYLSPFVWILHHCFGKQVIFCPNLPERPHCCNSIPTVFQCSIHASIRVWIRGILVPLSVLGGKLAQRVLLCNWQKVIFVLYIIVCYNYSSETLADVDHADCKGSQGLVCNKLLQTWHLWVSLEMHNLNLIDCRFWNHDSLTCANCFGGTYVFIVRLGADVTHVAWIHLPLLAEH